MPPSWRILTGVVYIAMSTIGGRAFSQEMSMDRQDDVHPIAPSVSLRNATALASTAATRGWAVSRYGAHSARLAGFWAYICGRLLELEMNGSRGRFKDREYVVGVPVGANP